MTYKSFFNWSGGKDSALALYHASRDDKYSIQKLLTNVNSQHRRVSMHGVREELLELQADAIAIPLQKLILPDEPTMLEYEEQMLQTIRQLQKEKFTHSLFGDIFLEDLKAYREVQLSKVNMQAVFPLWKRNTTELMHEFIALGFKTVVVCIKSDLLDQSFAGRIIDNDFLKDLPANVDPCGENGEFHTFVFDGPIFKRPVSYELGEKVFREYRAPQTENNKDLSSNRFASSSIGFWFCDLLPKNAGIK